MLETTSSTTTTTKTLSMSSLMSLMMNDVDDNDDYDDAADAADASDDDEAVTCVHTGTLESVELEIKVNNAACDRSYNISHFIQFIYLFISVCMFVHIFLTFRLVLFLSISSSLILAHLC